MEPWEVRLHPAVAGDLAQIAAAIRALAMTPHKGSLRDEIAPGLRAIPAARRAVIVFVLDDAARRVLVKAVGYAGSDWLRAAADRG